MKHDLRISKYSSFLYIFRIIFQISLFKIKERLRGKRVRTLKEGGEIGKESRRKKERVEKEEGEVRERGTKERG